MKPIGRRRKKLLGVDIGSASVKVLELSMSNGGCRVESCALEALPPDAVQEGNIRDVAAVGEALRRARLQSGSRARRGVLAVGGPSVIARTFAIDACLSDTEILARIRSDADRYVPYPLEEVAIDFEVRGLSEHDPGQAEVLLVACRREDIDRLRAVLHAAGLEPAVVEPEDQAVERLFELLEPRLDRQAGELVVALADIGATATTVRVLVDGRVVFSRAQPFGGRQQPCNEDAARHLANALRFFYSSSHYSDIDRIVLAGGAAATPGLADALQHALEAPAALADPFAGMSIAPRIDSDRLAANAPALALCCGLAMKGVE